MDPLEIRVVILETKTSSMESKFEKMENRLEQTHELVLEIKERLDKQNGWIPHLQQDIHALKESQIQLNTILNKNGVEDKEQSTRLKVIWGVMTAIGSAIIGYVLKGMFN
jgi:hypothetical protein